MLRYSILTIILCVSSGLGLLDNLMRAHNECYFMCGSKYGADLTNLDACRKGCDFKILNENCDINCKSVSTDELIQAGCIAGCLSDNYVRQPESAQPEHSSSITLIRLHKRPSSEWSRLDMSSFRNFFDELKEIEENQNGNEVLNDIQYDSSNSDNSFKLTRLIFYRKEDTRPKNKPTARLLENSHLKWHSATDEPSMIQFYINVGIVLLSSTTLLYMILLFWSSVSRTGSMSINAREKFDDTEEKVLLSRGYDQRTESALIKV